MAKVTPGLGPPRRPGAGRRRAQKCGVTCDLRFGETFRQPRRGSNCPVNRSAGLACGRIGVAAGNRRRYRHRAAAAHPPSQV